MGFAMRNDFDGQITLRDGRRLGFHAFGPKENRPLLYFHGFPGSRLEASWLRNGTPLHESMLPCRVYAIDRPGIGLSDYDAARSLCDWPEDIAQFADAVGAKRFTVMGVSGGGPYAAACAWGLPERVDAAGIVCGIGPLDDIVNSAGLSSFDRGFLHFLRRFPRLAKSVYMPFALAVRHWPLALLDSRKALLPELDRLALDDPGFREILSGSFRESQRQGSRGSEHELRLYSSPWGFDPAEIRVPVRLWHGEQDPVVPVAMARRLAAVLPNCAARFFPDDGHYSLLARWTREIVEDLVGSADVSG